ncbi:hypothetical protein [Klebsiella pneumoniae]|uniref:hypothetical protein n=1 Tax=Klebsiella pneumoniae TaxID=573 RepID=UPI0010293A2C|nr:hypothetical protein [Klebsiella pneumoniae]RZM50419.1 hypothetical protein C1455_03445 [Klebsiella pneumoniae]
MIKLTIPNDDSVALYHFGKSLISMAAAIDGAPDWVVITAQEYDRLKQLEELSQAQHIKVNIDSSDIEQLREALKKVEPTGLIQTDAIIDTTAQQVESLAAPDNDSPIITVNPTCHALSNEELQERGFDSTGTPWDERIHSASKALNADGTWRLRRKPKDMDEADWAATIQRVQDELRFPQEPVPVTPPGDSEFVVDPYDTYEEGELPPVVAVEPPVTPQGDGFHTDAGAVTEQTVAGIPPLPVPPPVVVAPPVPEVTEWDFPHLMTFLTERHGKIDVATVNTLLAQDGVLSVQELNAHPDKIGPFVARVKAHLGE